MKISRKITRKSAIISVAILVIAGAGTASALTFLNPTEDKSAIVSSKQAVVKPVEIKEDSQVVAQAEPAQETPVKGVAPAPVVPAVLSTQEYAEKYLDLSTDKLQTCFNDIVSAFPDRFSPDIREHNVQALLAFSNVCGVGFTVVQNPHYPMLLMAAGKNGEFFDSALAKQQWKD